MTGEILKGHLELLLLAALSAQPVHGYGIVEILRRRSGGTFELPEGTLYPALHRMEKSGLVVSRWTDDTGRRRRVYELTAEGQRSLKRREADWQQFAHAVNGIVEGIA
ncbi:MAG TPA: PadR family transcriptional regulator [Acidobacteriaceae bacterium]|jgi:transcriptional regulator|nr:PadR family transcriptional regulator [Acidobacteriaceae bacterium]